MPPTPVEIATQTETPASACQSANKSGRRRCLRRRRARNERCRENLAQALIDHEAARDLEFPQRARNQFLRLIAKVAPRRQLEVAQHALFAFERREQTGQADRRMGAGVEWQQQKIPKYEVGAR